MTQKKLFLDYLPSILHGALVVLTHYDHKVGVSYENEWYYNVLDIKVCWRLSQMMTQMVTINTYDSSCDEPLRFNMNSTKVKK
jgi:hypothetical protein